MTAEAAERIINVMRLKPLSTVELMKLAEENGVHKPYLRLIIEGLEARGWLIYEENGSTRKDNKYGVMEFHNGRSEIELCCAT